MRLTLLALFAAVLTGCGTANPIRDYPTFPTRYGEARATRAFTDILVAEDVSGRTDQVTLSTNQEIGGALTDSLVAWLGDRGYMVDQTYPAAVGLYVGDRARFVVRAEETALLDTAAVAPYLIDPEVLADTVLLASTQATILQGLPSAAMAETPEAVVFLMVRGRRVPLGKSLAQGIASGLVSGLLTGGLVTVSVWEQPFASSTLSVVDTATGEVIWRDTRFVKGSASDGVLRDTVRWLVKRLPVRTAGS